MDTTVVVVDGDPRAASIHASYIDSTPGFAVIGTAAGLGAATTLLAERPPDILLLDVDLPDGNGLDILRSVSVRRPELSVIATTAAHDRTAVHIAVRHGAVGYLTKPFGYPALRRHLETCLLKAGLPMRPGETLVQRTDVDAPYSAPHPTCEARRSVASSDTLKLVRATAIAAGMPVSAAEVAALAGVSRATAHRCLTKLVDYGALRVDPRYGHTGRPKNYYQPNGPG